MRAFHRASSGSQWCASTALKWTLVREDGLLGEPARQVERTLPDPLRSPLLHVDEHDACVEVTETGWNLETPPTVQTERRADERHRNVLHTAGDAALEVNREQLVDGIHRHRVRIEPEHAARRPDA